MNTVAFFGGVSAFLAVFTLGGAAITGAYFFRGRGELYGHLNDLFSAATLVLLILPAVAVLSLTKDGVGAWLDVVTWLSVGGLLLGALGQVLLVLRVISLGASFVTGGAGIMPVFAWWIAVAVVALHNHKLPDAIGWLIVAALGLIVLLLAAASVKIPAAVWTLSGMLVICLGAWFAALGVELINRS